MYRASGFLLDTNVVSEMRKRRPEQRAMDWVASRNIEELYISATVLGELVQGAAGTRNRPEGRRIERWIDETIAALFGNRVLPFDREAARIWGEIMGRGARAGRSPSALDAQIAAVAILHGLTVATRNTRDFEEFGVPLLDPWA